MTAAVGNPSPCIASNSRVLKITDEKGASVKNTSIAASVASEAGAVKTPRIVYLLVKPAEVSFVIQGSVDQEKSYLALAKKSKESEPVSVVGVVEE